MNAAAYNKVIGKPYKKIPADAYFEIIRTQLAAGGRASVRVTGSSMKPFLLPERDTLELEPYRGGMEKGDLILFADQNGGYILHRVTVPGERLFTMRGDNTVTAERGLPASGIVGTASSVTRAGKRIARGSAVWKAYALFGAFEWRVRFLWYRIFRPILSKIYHGAANRGGKDG